MALVMRELKGDDLFTLLSIVGKLDIKDEFIKMFEKNMESVDPKELVSDHKKKEPTKAEKEQLEIERVKEEKEAQKRGMEAAANLMQKVLLNLNKIKYDINSLLADLTGETVETIANLGLKDYTSLIITFFKKEELADFFSSIASLL